MRKLIDKLAPLEKYIIVASFLSLEVFAFIAFSFGSSFILFGALSFALMLLLILFVIKEINVDGVSRTAILFIPLVLYVLLTAIGIYSKYHVYTGDFNIAEVVFVPIGILSIGVCGYLLSLNKAFKLKTFFIVIYTALALLVFLNLLVNLINFGFFYTIIYKGYYMYFGGLRSSIPVNEMAYTLEGFNFIEVSMDHYVLYPVLLLSSSAFLFFINPKKEKKMFAIYVAFAALGLLSLIFVPSKLGLAGFLIVLVVDLIIFLSRKFEIAKKVVKYGAYVVLIAFILVMVILFIINQSFGSGLYEVFKNSSLLNRLFISNRFAKAFGPMIANLFVDNRFFGYYEQPITSFVYKEAHLSGSYVFDNLMTSGLLGALAFLFILLMVIKGFKRYMFNKEENEEYRYRGLLFSFFSVFYLYSLFFNNGEYGIFYNIIKPIYMTGPFMLTVFMMFYVFAKSAPAKKEAINHE